MHFLGAKERVVIYRTDEKQASGRADGSEGRQQRSGAGFTHGATPGLQIRSSAWRSSPMQCRQT